MSWKRVLLYWGRWPRRIPRCTKGELQNSAVTELTKWFVSRYRSYQMYGEVVGLWYCRIKSFCNIVVAFQWCIGISGIIVLGEGLGKLSLGFSSPVSRTASHKKILLEFSGQSDSRVLLPERSVCRSKNWCTLQLQHCFSLLVLQLF